MLTIRLENELESQLDKLSEQTGRPKAYFIREAIKKYLEDRSDYLLALKRLEDAGPRVSLEEVERELGLGR
jgi:RHH-type rel operon transcriptional repressor/antitoxin RelB